MPHVNVTIAGKTYRMACGEGEEDHLAAVASAFDARVGDMRNAFGAIGDMRLHVMAALTAFDELAELKQKVADLENEIGSLRAAAADGEKRLATEIGQTADRIDRLAKALSGGQAP